MRSDFSRRAFLRWLAVSAGGVMIASCQRVLEPITRASPEPTKEIFAQAAPPISAPPVAGQVPITPNQDFYITTAGATPTIPKDWNLVLTGLVDKPLTLTLDQIKAMPAATEMRTLECISNPVGGELISNALWKGVRLKDLLAQTGVKSAARHLKLESFDGWSTGIPLDLGMHEHALLAYEMNGEPLPLEHGAPLRCLWTGRYGMKQPKWIQTITVINTDYAGFWEKQGWTNDAFILPNSRIDSPQDNGVITSPTFTVSGVAFSGEDGIAKIEISWDDTNQWHAAELTRGPSPFVWTIWKWTGQSLAPGKHQLFARVTTNDGKTQARPEKPSLFGDTFPNGTDQMHSIVVEFRA